MVRSCRPHCRSATFGRCFSLNRLRVFRSAEASRVDPSGGQQLHTRAVRSEECMRLRGRVWTGMHVIAMFFGPCAPDMLTAHMSVFSHYFQGLDIFIKLAATSLVKHLAFAHQYRAGAQRRTRASDGQSAALGLRDVAGSPRAPPATVLVAAAAACCRQ